MTAPRYLVDWPEVQLDVECSLCPRHGRYRLARLAERYGAAVPLGRLLEMVASDCTLMKPNEKPRQYEARCGIRYVVPPTRPMPADAPARAGAPRLDTPKGGSGKRLVPDGVPPTLAMLRQQGITAVLVTCHGLRQGHTCHHSTTLPLDRLGAPNDVPFPDLCRVLRFVCSRCGCRAMNIVPLWPDPRRARATSLGIDSDLGMSGTVVPRRAAGPTGAVAITAPLRLATSWTGPHSGLMTDVAEDRRPTALVVDDDAILRMDATDILTDAGFRTLEAEDGDAAIVSLEQHHLDIVLMFSDVEMPGSRDGFALAREAAVRWPSVAIVVASGRRRPADGELPEGARFIGKPFSAEVVHGHLREILPDERKPDPLR